MSWTKCPVCDGYGVVGKTFYPESTYVMSTSMTIYAGDTVPCRTCHQKGALETKESVVNHYYYSIFGKTCEPK